MTMDQGVTPQAKPRFSALGHHSTIYYVALPPIIPQDVRDKMISRFRGYLCDQLRRLVRPARNDIRHQSTPSLLGTTQECQRWVGFEDDWD